MQMVHYAELLQQFILLVYSDMVNKMHVKRPTLLVLTCIILASLVVSSCGADVSQEETDIGEGVTTSEIIAVGNTDINGSSAVTDQGRYDVYIWLFNLFDGESPWIHTGNITYLDVESLQKVFLCNTPGCEHNNEDCTAYISFSNSAVMFTNKTKSKLYCMSTGAKNGEVFTANDVGKIYEMDLDGTNRKELIGLKANQSFASADPIFSDEEFIYLAVIETNTNKSESTKKLFRISIVDGSITEVGTYPVNCVVLQILSPRKVVVRKSESYMGSIVKIDLVSKEEEVLYTEPTGSEKIAGEDLVYFETSVLRLFEKDGSLTLGTYNYLSKEQNEITICAYQEGSCYLISKCFDDKVIIDCSANEEKHSYLSVDLVNGDVSKNVLTFDYQGVNRVVNIICELNSDYLVAANITKAVKTIVDNKGVPHEVVEDHEIIYAMISKDDYWSGIANYRWVTNYT